MGTPFPSPGDLPHPGIKGGSPALQADSLSSEPQGKPFSILVDCFEGSSHFSHSSYCRASGPPRLSGLPRKPLWVSAFSSRGGGKDEPPKFLVPVLWFDHLLSGHSWWIISLLRFQCLLCGTTVSSDSSSNLDTLWSSLSPWTLQNAWFLLILLSVHIKGMLPVSSKEKRMLFLGGGSRGESRYNGQNQNWILTGCEPVITNNVTISKKNGWKRKNSAFYLDKLHFQLADCQTWREGLFPWMFLQCAFRLMVRLPGWGPASRRGQV